MELPLWLAWDDVQLDGRRPHRRREGPGLEPAVRPHLSALPDAVMTRECLLPGCGAKISWQFHFCKTHWDKVPARLQDAVNRTYAASREILAFNPTVNEMRRKQWQLARGVAVVAVQYALGQITEDQMVKTIGNASSDAKGVLRADEKLTEKEIGYADPDKNAG